MTLLNPEELQKMVDYSFGDQSGVLGGVPNAYMHKANFENTSFASLVRYWDKKMMTLFIDNIRLYRRPLEYSDWLHMKPISWTDKVYLQQFEDEDLLKLCATMPEMKFIIFTAFEDTPLDDYIWDKIPENVLGIYAANGVVFGGKVHPFPHGIERDMYEGYDHHEILESLIDVPATPEKLLFVAHRADTGNRTSLGSMFHEKPWATVTHLPYEQYLHEMRRHKFVLCPSGNGIGSSRNWETLYMRRVPVFEDHPYKRELFKDFPVLFVKDYSEVTEELLKANEHLFDEMQKMDMEKLSMKWWFTKALYENL